MRTNPIACPSVLLATFLFGCSGGHDSNAAKVIERDSSGVQIVESLQDPPLEPLPDGPIRVDSEPVLSIGVEEGDEALQLHRVSDALRLSDGRILMANSGSQELRVFDSTGTYIKSVGRRGEGPGEFGEFSSPQLHRVGSRVLATDNDAFRVHLFDEQLTFLETRRFTLTAEHTRPILRGVFADGSLMALTFSEGGALRGATGTVITPQVSLVHYDSTGLVTNELGAFTGRLRYVNTVNDMTHYPYIPLTVDPLDAVDGNRAIVLRGNAPEFEFRDSQGVVERIVRWSRPRVLSRTLWPAYRDHEVAELATARERDKILYGAFYKQDLPIPEYAPLYQTMKVDEVSRVWLERYRLPGDTAAPVWDVIDTAGRWIAAVPTPQGVMVYRIGNGFLLGRSRDESDVERVVLYRVIEKH